MIHHDQAQEIIRALRVLPPDKVQEVRDFVLFLKERYAIARAVDESDVWTEEDLRDVSEAAWKDAAQGVPWTE